jgi:hypothetical protein
MPADCEEAMPTQRAIATYQGGDGSRGPSSSGDVVMTSGPDVVATIAKAVLDHFAQFMKFDGDEINRQLVRQIDRHVAFFIYRRALFLASIRADWRTSPYDALKARLDVERQQVDDFIRTKGLTGNGPFDDKSPPHFDLRAIAKTKGSTPWDVQHLYERHYVNERQDRVHSICWRAAALHKGLWNPDWSSDSQLDRPALGELLDRRLRAVERMAWTIGRVEKGYPGLGEPTWSLGIDAQGKPVWNDGFIVRMFEYPKVHNNPAFRAAIGEANISTATNKPWYDRGTFLYYNVGGWGLYFKPAIQGDVAGDPYPKYKVRLTPKNGKTGTQLVTELFTPHTNWWERSWLYCDMVMAACNIEALQFGLHRRSTLPAAQKDDVFNALFTANGYVALGAFVQSPNAGHLMANEGSDPHFTNGEIPAGELEVGDQFIFWNSFVYSSISGDEWALENAFVTRVDSDPKTNSILTERLELQGHGSRRLSHATFQADLAKRMVNGLKAAQAAASSVTNPSVKAIPFMGKPNLIVRWDPYDPFTGPSAWWLKIFFGGDDDRLANLEGALGAIPQALYDLQTAPQGLLPPAGPGYRPPHEQQPATGRGWVLFPLFVPKITDKWTGYLRERATNQGFKRPQLDPIVVDGTLVPGLFLSGASKDVAVIKPKARKTVP